MKTRQIIPSVWSCLDDDTPLFRFLPKDRFLELVEKGINVLTHITHWEDPYEAFLLRAELETAAEISDDNLTANVYDKYKLVYGQSWSLHKEESELRWRAYCPNRDGVRIETTLRQLAESISRTAGDSKGKQGAAYIGKVEYSPREEFSARMMRMNHATYHEAAIEEIMQWFFIKRNEFSEEEEVRVIVCPDEASLDKSKDVDGSLLRIEVQPTEWINRVYVDPRMDRRDFQQIVCRLRYRCPDMRIQQSQLFNWPRIPTPFGHLHEREREPEGVRNAYARFWGMLQHRFDPADNVVGQLGLKGRKPSDKSDWDLGHVNGCHCRLTFNNSETRINVYVTDPRDGELTRTRFDSFRTDFPAEEITESGLLGGGMRFSLRNVEVGYGDESTWQSAIEWFSMFVPRFYRCII